MPSPLALALLLAPAPAPAENPAPLGWRAPAGCPDASVLAERIERLVQRPLAAGELSVEADVQAALDGFTVDLRVVAGAVVDERTLFATDCATLADAAALVGAVLLDPVVTTASVDVEAAASADVPEPRASEQPRSLRIRRADKPREPDRLGTERSGPRPRRDRELAAWIRLRGGPQFGAVPGTSGGLELAIGLGVRRVRGEIAGSWWAPRRLRNDVAPLTVQLGTIAPRVCATVPQRKVDVVACGGVELGVMRTRTPGLGVRQPLWLGFVAEAGIRAPLTPRLSLWASAMATIPVVFPEFRLEDTQTPPRTRRVYQPPGAGVRGLLGLEVRLRGLDKRQ